MTRYIILAALISIVDLAYGQVDTTTIDSIRIVTRKNVWSYCPTFTKDNKTYEVQIGETFHRTVLANGWFKRTSDSCYQDTWIQEMIRNQFYLDPNDYHRFKRGKPYGGRIRGNDGEYKITGRCKKGKPHGKFIILDIKNDKIIWEGVISMYNE
jgi:hypothetical protein